MFEFIRTHRRWMQLILLLLIVPSFVFVGAQGYDTFVSNEPEVAVVGETPITASEFERVRLNQLDQMRQNMGAQFDVAMADTPQTRQRLLNDLINQRLMETVARDNRFSVSDETLRNTIASIPAVQDEGQFSPERYRQVLAAQGMTPASFEASVRADLAVGRVLAPIGGSAHVPDAVTARLDTALSQTRTVQTQRFAAADYTARVKVSDEDIKAWYDANQKALEIPQYANIQYLLLDEAAATEGVRVTDDQINQYFEQNKSRFGRPERRRASHIMIEVPTGASEDVRNAARTTAEQIATEAQANPDGFAALAKEKSQDTGSAATGGDLGWVSAGVLPAELESAVNGLNLNQVSQVVQSPSGYHVLKLTQLEPGEQKTLAEVREQVTSEIRKQLASERFAKMATQMTAVANEQRDSLEPAAQATGLSVRSASGILRTGLMDAEDAGKDAAQDSPDAQWLENPRVRQAVFSPQVMQEGFNSGVIELASDRLMVVRLAEMVPQRVPALDVVADTIRERLIAERAATMARDAGTALIAKLKAQGAAPAAAATAPTAGPAPEVAADAPRTEAAGTDAATAQAAADTAKPTVAESGLASFGAPQTVSRQSAGTLSQPVFEAVLGMPANELPGYAGIADGNDFVVARLEKIEAGDTNQALKDQLNQQVRAMWGEAEDRAVIQMLRDQYKVKITPEAARIIEGEPTPAG